MTRLFAASLLAVAITGTAVQAQQVGITPGQAEVRLEINGTPVVITRIQDTDNELTGAYARTSRPCPSECLTPMRAAPGIETFGELEVLAFLQTDVQAGTGLLIDTRLPSDYADGHIPGAVNVPFTTLEATNPFRDQILIALGAQDRGTGQLDFSNARRLTLYCDGPWCGDARRNLRSLAEAGYPPNKLFSYRGGMQSWRLMGLSVQEQ